MAILHFTTMLLLCHTLLSANGVSSILPSGTTAPPTSTSTPSPTTSPPCEAIGAQVNITVYVWVSSCSEASHQNVSSPEYRDLERNIRGNLTDFNNRGGVNYALNITLQTTQCMGNYVKVVLTITFKLRIGFNTEEDTKTEVSNNSLVSLPANGTLTEVAFICVSSILPSITIVPPTTSTSTPSPATSPPCEGQSTSSILPSNAINPLQPVAPQTSTSNPSTTTPPEAEGFNITYNIKDGECKRVCCNGAGGPVKMTPTCNPPSDHSSCTKEREENDRCPGDARDLCSSICGSRSAHCASFALVGLLAIAAFFK